MADLRLGARIGSGMHRQRHLIGIVTFNRIPEDQAWVKFAA